MARLRGNSSDNLLSIDQEALSNTRINGRGGFDTLYIGGDEEIDLDFSITRRWRNLESIDFSDYQANLSLVIDDRLLSRNGSGNLEIISANQAILALSAPTSSIGTVTVSGEGTTQLADGVNNNVIYGDGAGTIIGGSGNDTIAASESGNILSGGDGNDILVGNSGRDTFVHGLGDGQDVLKIFDVSNDVIALSGIDVDSFYSLQAMMENGASGVTITFASGSSVIIEGIATHELVSANFTLDGETLPQYLDTIAIEPGISAAELNGLIEDVPAGTTLILANGIHTFTEKIVLSRDDITITGESETGTLLEFSFPNGSGGSYIETTGGEKTYVDTLNAGAETGSNRIVTDDGHGLTVGDAVYIYQPNTQDYLDENGWGNVSFDDADSRPFREFITTVANVDGGTITLTDPVPYDFDAHETRIFSVELLDGISLSNFTIINDLGETNDFDMVNTQLDFEGAVGINLAGTQEINLSGITILDAPSTAIGLSTSIRANISDIHIDGSHNLGGGGNGYGIELSETFNNSLASLEIYNVRHSLVLSAWNAETGNSIEVLDTNRDINFHGSPDNGNSVFVFSAELEYDSSQDTGGGSVWSIVSGGGASHAATSIFEDNQVEFVHAVGSGNVDTIFAFEGGAYLNGKGSNDVLVGGVGDDVLVGGRRRDVLTGDDGTDIFIFNMGDDLDRITDFEFGSGGDVFVVMGNPGVSDFDDLTITQDGADTRVRYGSNSTVVLEDIQISEIDPTNFVFDPQAALYNDLWLGV
ncbi:MAG: hypothetical protein AAF412_00470 [Pseudomonadota bacterium]